MTRVNFTPFMAQTITRARQSAGLSQAEVADRIGVLRANVKRWESCQVQTIPQNILEALQEVLNTSLVTREVVSSVPVKRKGSSLAYYRVTFDSVTPVRNLFGSIKVVDIKNGIEVYGQVSGVESSRQQSKRGIAPGESVVLAILPADGV